MLWTMNRSKHFVVNTCLDHIIVQLVHVKPTECSSEPMRLHQGKSPHWETGYSRVKEPDLPSTTVTDTWSSCSVAQLIEILWIVFRLRRKPLNGQIDVRRATGGKTADGAKWFSSHLDELALNSKSSHASAEINRIKGVSSRIWSKRTLGIHRLTAPNDNVGIHSTWFSFLHVRGPNGSYTPKWL